jgi:hypothetical protein
LWIAPYSNQPQTVSDTHGRWFVGWYVRQDGDAWATNAVVSTIALPFWAYLMGAVAFAPYHDGNLAAILVMSFTVVSGLVAPRADKPKLREQSQEVATPERLPGGRGCRTVAGGRRDGTAAPRRCSSRVRTLGLAGR